MTATERRDAIERISKATYRCPECGVRSNLFLVAADESCPDVVGLTCHFCCGYSHGEIATLDPGIHRAVSEYPEFIETKDHYPGVLAKI